MIRRRVLLGMAGFGADVAPFDDIFGTFEIYDAVLGADEGGDSCCCSVTRPSARRTGPEAYCAGRISGMTRLPCLR